MSRTQKPRNVRLTTLERLHLLKLLELNVAERASDGDAQRWWERTARLAAKLKPW